MDSKENLIIKKHSLKILFVSSGNLKNFDIAPFIKVQGDSLKSENIYVDYYKIKGKGLLGYLKNISELRRFIKRNNFDLIHAHFTLSAWVSVLSFSGLPIVLSLMGTDAFGRLRNVNNYRFYNKYLTFLTILIQPFVSIIISKSPNINKYVWLKKKSIVLPNGVNLEDFDGKRVDYSKELGLNPDKKHILFLGNPFDANKNYSLLTSIESRLQKSGFVIINPFPCNHKLVMKLLSTVDILVMCSLKEGSPNVVKEALASNCKGVFTDVGDVKFLVDGVEGYAICGWTPDELEEVIYKVDSMERCKGRERIKELQLDSKTVAKKLNKIYLSVYWRKLNALKMKRNELGIKIKVLFVSSGNLKNFDVAPFIKVQGDSLRDLNVDVEYFRISGKGFFGYLSNVKSLKSIIKNSNFDLIHAHFTLSAWVAVLTFPKIPIVLSLMGTDAYGRVETLKKNKLYINYFTFLTVLIQPFINKIISKSPNIQKFVWIKKKSFLLPNGVDLEKFYPSEKHFRNELGMAIDRKYILFLGNTKDPRKNFNLLKNLKSKLQQSNIELIAPYPIPHEKVFQYLNSVDLLVMCSFEEGSPNVVKEGMACNCKGVFTDVGDVRYLIENTEGYAISEFKAEDLLNKILQTIDFENCDGRKRILELGLNLPTVASKLKNIYINALTI